MPSSQESPALPPNRAGFAHWTPAAALLLLPAAAQANLGSFTSADGYDLNHFQTQVGAVNWTDVTYYNAGAYGANAGGGSGPTLATPDSGLWSVVGPAGGFYPTTAARSADVGTAPPYPGIGTGQVPAYLVGNHGPGRTDNSSLAFRNQSASGTGPAVYDYRLDTYDTGGPAPASITGGTLRTEFYFCPNPDQPASGAYLEKFSLSFRDSLGNTGLQWGYARDNQVGWRTGTSGPWNTPGIQADAANWDGVRVDIDLTNDTFLLDYYDISGALWINVVPAGTPLGSPLLDLTGLRWQLEDDVSLGNGGKNFFDDFAFTLRADTGHVVPEASTWAAGAVAAGFAAWMSRRRRNPEVRTR